MIRVQIELESDDAERLLGVIGSRLADIAVLVEAVDAAIVELDGEEAEEVLH